MTSHRAGHRTDNLVIVAGGGIGGLATALTLHQIGVPCLVLEAVPEMRPLGVGINLQPNAVRELYELGFTRWELDRVGLPAKEWALVGLNGNDIYSEPRGPLAGYNWPQYAVHRGRFHVALYDKVVERIGAQAVQLGARVTGYARNPGGGVTALIERADGSTYEVTGALLIGADGIHSAVRAQMHPAQPPIHWGGAVMWRGTTQARPIRTGSSFVGLGTHRHRIVLYPISHPDRQTGLSTINWIAEVTMDNAEGWKQSGWFRQVGVEDCLPHFKDWVWDWLDVPALLRDADTVFENPMIDRDPVPTWADGPVALLGDAAHAMYPTGSNGGSQAIVDARVLGAAMVEHGVTPAALAAYDARLCAPISQLILRNRGAGPFGLLNMVDERCGGTFDSIDDVIPPEERARFMAGYQAAAGFAKETLNAAPPTIPHGARVGGAVPAIGVIASMLQAKVEAAMDRVQEPAILALRPYPPVDLPGINSQLGGLPILPSEASWPRATDGTPLHFLARIDCFELPQTRGPLPEYGVLQFFARIDEEMIWDGPASGYARVLYSEHATGRATPPPADLPPIMGGWHDYDREMRLPDEPHTRIYPHWPLTFRSIRSWPQLPPIDLRPESIRLGNPTIKGEGGVRLNPYLDAVERARAAEIVRTTGRPTNPLRTPQWGEISTKHDGKRVVRLPAMGFPLLPRGTPAFPQACIQAERIARALACLANEELGELPERKPPEGVDPEQLRADLEEAANEAQSWARRAQEAGLDAGMAETDAKAFMEWLTPLSADERWDLAYLVSRAVKRGMSSAIKYCGGSRAAAAIVPVGYMNYLEGEHFLTAPDTYGIEVSAPRRRIIAKHHQLLGHAPASQGVEVKPDDVLLLHLVSDRGVDFMFCDAGEIQFWIDADDLAARRFDRVRANTQGG